MKVNVTVSLDEEILDRAKAIAISERRSFSSQLEKWIDEKLKEAKEEEGGADA